jgi:hypothetical protein
MIESKVLMMGSEHKGRDEGTMAHHKPYPQIQSLKYCGSRVSFPCLIHREASHTSQELYSQIVVEFLGSLHNTT